MGNELKSNSWRLNRQISISTIVQILLLASLIIGSWLNLQCQLDVVGHDVSRLLEGQQRFGEKLEAVSADVIAHEYQLRSLRSELELIKSERQYH